MSNTVAQPVNLCIDSV